MTYRIDKATFNDIENLCAVQAAAIERFGTSEYSDEEIRAWVGHRVCIPHMANVMSDDGSEFFAARSLGSGMVCGFSAISGNQITDIYVDPMFAGEGIGTALLRKAEWHIRKNRGTFARLLSTLNSVGFYAGHGYNKLWKRQMSVNDSVDLDVLEMHKRLTLSVV